MREAIFENSCSPHRPASAALALDVVVALALLAACLGLYGATFQLRSYGDGDTLGSCFVHDPEGQGTWIHPAYFAAGHAMARLDAGRGPAGPLRRLSVWSGALGVAFTFLFLRRSGVRSAQSISAGALLAAAPVVWFFATTIEVHSLHFAAVAFSAWITVCAPWRRPLAALALVFAAFPFLHFTHRSAILLAPGWLFLIAFARARVAPPFRARTLLLLVAPVVAGAELASMTLVNLWFDRGLLPFDLDAWNRVVADAQGFRVLFLWHDWALPLGFLAFAAVCGAAANPPRGLTALTLVGLLFPALLFFWIWGIGERGAYALGTVPFLAWAAARCEPMRLLPRAWRSRAAGIACAALALGAQVALAQASLRSHASGIDRATIEERARWIASTLGQEGVLISFEDRLPYVDLEDARVREFSGMILFRVALDQNIAAGADGPQSFAHFVSGMIDGVLADGFAVALDTGFDRLGYVPGFETVRAFPAALELEVRRRPGVESHAHPRWPLLVLRTQGGDGR